MKKLLPIMMFVLLAFAGCQREPATYQMTGSPREVAANAEKFANQVKKQSKHYSDEDWQDAVKQFVAMSKNFVEHRDAMTEEEIMRFNNARLQFMAAIDANGSEELTKQVKDTYARVIQ